ncbi:MAG: DAK2 domain-containing protein [Anaerolineaceae bacterium]|nr:DAK2 domain-containing protein [Anaerolineaceae bacterium]
MAVDGKAVVNAFRRVAKALLENQENLLALDQAMGDGDLGITLAKIAVAMEEYVATVPADDLGKFLANAGMAANRVGSSSMGTLLATGLMRAGKEARGLAQLSEQQLALMLTAADQGVLERGKAQVGDKTLVDALHPAAEAFAAAVASGVDLRGAGLAMLGAAEEGRDRVTPLQSRIGRASWIGERTIGLVDPGCEALVVIFRALVNG